jgi:hypothetical protein
VPVCLSALRAVYQGMNMDALKLYMFTVSGSRDCHCVAGYLLVLTNVTVHEKRGNLKQNKKIEFLVSICSTH